jgi:hypothetical protein
MQLENTVITETTPQPDGDSAAPVTLENLFTLLEDEPAAEAAPEGDKDGAAAGDGSEGAKPEMFNDLADSLGIGLDDLYNLKVTTVDGETVTIEHLKALQGSQDNITIRELEFEETWAAKEGDLRQAQNELAEIVAALPNGTIKPEVMEKLRAKNAARIEVEQSRTLAAIPTWKDEATRTADLVGMSEHLERFGFPPNHMASVSDHRMFMFIRESHLREQRIKTALERVRAGKPNPTTPTKATGKAPGKTAATPTDSHARNGLEAFLKSAT